MKLEITKPQLLAIINVADNMSAMLGCCDVEDDGYDFDAEMAKEIRLIDRFLKKNGYKRNYK